MDNHLTPNRIQRLIHLAEDKSFNLPRRIAQNSHDDTNRSISTNHTPFNKTNCESSSGILDLERVQGFGESGIGNMSLSKSSAFNPGEMTGRSTGADDLQNPVTLGTRLFEDYGRHSVALDSITSHMDRQTSEINDLMRHSIATNYSFNGKRDLTADEASLVMREAPMPVQQSTEVNFLDSIVSNSNMSVGAYFKNKCPMLVNILGNTDSPDRSMNPSITEVSSHVPIDSTPNKQNNTYKIDPSLDSVPVRQPKSIKFENYDTSTKNKNEQNYMAKSTENRDISSLKCEKNMYKALDPELSVNKSTMKAEVSMLCPLPKAVDSLKIKPQSSFKLQTEETESSLENSLSISKIADYIRRQSNLSVTELSVQLNNQMKQMNRKQPLSELQMNLIENKQNNQEVYVTNLIDSKKMETASSSSTVKTVISQDKLKMYEKNVPSVVITKDSLDAESVELRNLRTPRMARSKSPSSKSQSTLTTVHENRSFKSSNSPLHSSKGEANASHIPSPNVVYKELDKSVDWHEVMQQKHFHEERFAKDQWVEILTKPVEGYVGVSEAVVIEITTLTQTWLTAKIQFENLPNGGKDLTIELPRLPLLLSPGKTEKFTVYITSNIEMNTNLPFAIYLKDASIDREFEQKGSLEVDIKMPSIQAVSCDGVNKISFPLIQEKTSLTKYFVLLSDCQADLQLELSIMTGDSMFVIKNVQEINKSDVSKVLMERQASSEDQPKKGKLINKLLCRLSGGNAIKVTIMFTSPKLSDLGIMDQMATFKGCLNVNLIGVDTVLKKVNLLASVGTAHLEVQTTGDRIVVSNEPTSITMYNSGMIPGAWVIMFKSVNGDTNFPFKVSASRIEVRPGESKQIHVVYTGPQDVVHDGKLILEEVTTSTKTEINITGGSEKPKSFPIKTNFNNMSWVRAGRKELSLKNSTNKKIQIRCQIVGDGFAIDSPGLESRGTYLLTFGPCECRPLPIIFSPTSSMPFAASLHLVYDKNSDFSRKIKLHGCALPTNEGVRWGGALVTYGETALVRAARRQPIDLTLYNRTGAPAFVAVAVHFNLQYRSLSDDAELLNGRRIIPRRSAHTVSLRVSWGRVERRAHTACTSALASLTVLAGPELTRRRILRILRNEGNGQLDTSLLPDHVKVLAEEFEGEDPSMDNYLENFSETKASLNELIESLQELTAQIDLPQDFSEDNTILISDDTMIDHHTLCE
ncbi:unnamed protein product [Colias eurytheme]|nr:unnamed protein product [Colias eurytheme]